MMNQNLMQIAKAMCDAVNQDWIINARSNLINSCEKMIELLDC